MAFSANQVGLGSYLNPNDLLPDEISYELNLRGLNLSGYCLEDQKQALRKAQLDEIQNSKVIYSTKTIIDDLSLIQIKLTTVRQELELYGPTRQLMSRLRHLRLRVLRSNALDSYQVRIKNELLEELELIYDVFATPEDQISGLRRSTLGRKSLPSNLGAIPRDPALEFPPPPQVPRSSEIGAAENQPPRVSNGQQEILANPQRLQQEEMQLNYQFQGSQFRTLQDQGQDLQQRELENQPQGQEQPQQPNQMEHAPVYASQQPLERQDEEDQVDNLNRQQLRQIQLQQEWQNRGQLPRLNNHGDDVLREVRQNQVTVGQGRPEGDQRRYNQLERGSAVDVELPPIPEGNEQGLSRAEVSRIVEDVMTNKLEEMMTNLRESMQDLLANHERRNTERQDRTDVNRSFERAIDRINFSTITNPQIQPQLNQASNSPVIPPNFQESRQRLPNRDQEFHSRNESQPRNRTNNFSGIERDNIFRTPINKWQIRFSGEPRGMSVEEFVKRVEVLARNNQISDTELLNKANFLFKPESPAEIWYYTFSNKFTSWAVLKYHLRLRFEVPNKDKVLERQIRDRKQLPNETFVAYLGEIERLCQQMSKPIDEKVKLDIMFENMKDWYRPHLAFLNTTQLTVETLCSLCYELDKSVYRSYAQRNRTYGINNVEELESEGNVPIEDEYTEEVNAINRIRPQRNRRPEDRTEELPTIPTTENNILCWNCNQYGHFWRNCGKGKRIFCHVCGRPDVVLSNCPSDHNNLRPNNSKNEYRGSN